MTSTKRLSGHAPSERREHLKQYLLACVRDSVLSWADLMNPNVLDKFLRVVSQDVKTVAKDLGRAGASGLLQIAGSALAGIAEDVVAGRRPRR